MKILINVYQHVLIFLFVYLLGLAMVPIPLEKLNINVVNFINASKEYLPMFGLWLTAVNMLPYLIVSFVILFAVIEDDDIIKIMDLSHVRRSSILLFAGYVCLYFIYQSPAYTYDIYFFMGYGPLLAILFYICMWKDPYARYKIISFFNRTKIFIRWFVLRIKV